MQNANHFKYIEEMIDQKLGKFKQQIAIKENEVEELNTDLKNLQEL